MWVLVCCAALCRHVYRSHILGLAGSFSQEQLADLKRCLPDGSVDYIEEDVQVMLLLMPLVPTAVHTACKDVCICLLEMALRWLFSLETSWFLSVE